MLCRHNTLLSLPFESCGTHAPIDQEKSHRSFVYYVYLYFTRHALAKEKTTFTQGERHPFLLALSEHVIRFHPPKLSETGTCRWPHFGGDFNSCASVCGGYFLKRRLVKSELKTSEKLLTPISSRLNVIYRQRV